MTMTDETPTQPLRSQRNDDDPEFPPEAERQRSQEPDDADVDAEIELPDLGDGSDDEQPQVDALQTDASAHEAPMPLIILHPLL